MKATEFCKFFEFTLEKEHGIVPEADTFYGGNEYNYIATDDQGVFNPRYAMEVNDLVDLFDICLKNYIDDNLEEDGFEFDKENTKEDYYEQALKWARENKYSPYIAEILEALVSGELEDDTEVIVCGK